MFIEIYFSKFCFTSGLQSNISLVCDSCFREDGEFDFMVNGGGAVTLQFGKSPFPPVVETLFAPWNEVPFRTYNF